MEKLLLLYCFRFDDYVVLQILQYHIVPQVAATSDALSEGQVLPTFLEGETLTVSLDDGIKIVSARGIEPANVVAADIKACGAVIHKIDSVLIPNGESELLG